MSVSIEPTKSAHQRLNARLGVPVYHLKSILGDQVLRLVGLLVLVALWHLGSRWLQSAVPLAGQLGPIEAVSSLQDLAAHGHLWQDTLASLRRVGVSLALALIIGIPIGLAIGSFKRLDTVTSAAFQFLRMISPLSWMPIAVMLLGIGDHPIYFLLTITAIWPIILNTSAGVRQLDPHWLTLAKSLCATKIEVLFKIILPGIIGHILTGVRLAIGIIWILLVPCEMLGVSSGLGYLILDTRDRLAYSELMAVILIIGVLGFILDSLAKRLYQHWR